MVKKPTLRVRMSTMLAFAALWVCTWRRNIFIIYPLDSCCDDSAVPPAICDSLVIFCTNRNPAVINAVKDTDLLAAWSRVFSSGKQSNWKLLPTELLR